MHNFRYSILFTFLMGHGRAPNGIGHLMILYIIYAWGIVSAISLVEQIIAYLIRIFQIMIQATDLVHILYRGHPAGK